MEYKKNNNAITININDDLKKEIEIIAAHHQRKIADMIRVLLTPVIINEYAKIQKKAHPENNTVMTEAIFKL